MSTRKLDFALTLGIALELLEILRRLPRWLLYGLGILTLYAATVVYLHPWWAAAAAAVVVLVLRRIRGRPRRPA